MNCKLLTWLLIGSVGAGCGGCATKAGTGAVVGAGTGAAVGGIIGSMSHARAGEGALIGAGVGAIGGALVGHAMDESDKKKEREFAEAEPRPAASKTLSQRDVIKWSARGTRDDIIIDRIERSGTVFRLTTADEQELREAGVSEMVIQDMKATARR